MTSQFVRVIVLCGLCTASGCAMFRGNELQDIGAISPLTSPRSSRVAVTYQFVGTILKSGKTDKDLQEIWDKNVMWRKQEERFVDVLKESGHFTSVVAAPKGGDIHIDARFTQDMHMSPTMYLILFTGFFIPAWETHNCTFDATVRLPDTRPRRYNIHDSIRTVWWLPMIFVAPFGHGPAAGEEMERNMFRHFVRRMENDKIIPSGGPTVPQRPPDLRNR